MVDNQTVRHRSHFVVSDVENNDNHISQKREGDHRKTGECFSNIGFLTGIISRGNERGSDGQIPW